MIDALLAALDGSTVLRAHAENNDPMQAGDDVADAVFAQGGTELLDA